MFLPFNEIEDFLMLLDAMIDSEEKKTFPVFVSTSQAPTENGMLIGEIVIQFQYDNNMLAVFHTSDGIDPVMMPSQPFFAQVQYYLGDDAAKTAKAKSEEMIKKQDMQLETELKKAIEMLTTKDIKNIIPVAWNGV